MIAFRSRVSGEVLNDDGEACRRIQLYGKLLGQVELFRRVSKEDLQHAAASLVNLTYYKDEYIIEQGEAGNTFFVLLVGEAAVEVDGHCVRQCHGCLPDTSETSILKFLQQEISFHPHNECKSCGSIDEQRRLRIGYGPF